MIAWILLLFSLLCIFGVGYAYSRKINEYRQLETAYDKLQTEYQKLLHLHGVLEARLQAGRDPLPPGRQIVVGAEWWSTNPNSFTPRDPGLGETLTEDSH